MNNCSRKSYTNRYLVSKRLALSCLSNGFYGKALAHLCVAGKLHPQKASKLKTHVLLAFEKVIELFFEKEAWEEIFQCLEETLLVFPWLEDLPHKIGCILYRLDEQEKALYCFKQALAINPHYLPSSKCIQNIHNQVVERWHFRMLNDTNRNAKYHLVLQNAQSNLLLDIGTGTGLLSMFAAQSTCINKIYACEGNLTMHNICKDILRDNNLDQRIVLLQKFSQELAVGKDLPEKVDLVVTELFDSGLLGEGVLRTLDHAWRELLLPVKLGETDIKESTGGRVIPHSATVFVMLIECQWLRKHYRLVDAHRTAPGFSLTSDQSSREPYSSEFLSNIPEGYKKLSNPCSLFQISFNNAKEIHNYLKGKPIDLVVEVIQSGLLDAVVLWFELHLDDKVTISSEPGSKGCWEQAIFPITDEFHVANESSVRMEFFCQDHIQLKSITPFPCTASLLSKNVCQPIKEEWIRLLNDLEYCEKLSLAIQEALSSNKRLVLDTSALPIGGILAAQYGAEKIALLTDVASEEEVFKICQALGIETSRIEFSSFEKLTSENFETLFDILILQLVDFSGELKMDCFEDLALLSSTCLSSTCSIIPKKITIQAKLIDSSVLFGHCKVIDNGSAFNLKISEPINKYRTVEHQDIHLETLPYQSLSSSFNASTICLDKNYINYEKNKIIELGIINDGCFTAIIYWFVIELSKDLTYDTSSNDLFSQSAFVTSDCFDVKRNDTLEVNFSCQNSILHMHASK